MEEEMSMAEEEEVPTIFKDFSPAICGTRLHKSVKLENVSKEATTFTFLPNQFERFNNGFERLTIYPEQMDIPPGKSGRFKLTYLSYLENITDNVKFDILESERAIGKLHVRAQSVGPVLSLKSNTVKFLWFRDVVRETTKLVEFANKVSWESRFCFDTDKDAQTFQVSPICGVIPGGTKLNVKVTFQPKEYGVYYKRIFCLIQFQEPLILNVIGIWNPRCKLVTRNLSFNKELPNNSSNSYEAYMGKLHSNTVENIEKISYSEKCTEEFRKCLKDLIAAESKSITESMYELSCEGDCEEKKKDSETDSTGKDDKEETAHFGHLIFLTTYFIDIKNVRKIPGATTLVNLSASKSYSYHWEHDVGNHFQVEPCKGIIFPKEKISFCLFFTPSVSDQLYHKEIDLRIFPYSEEPEGNASQMLQLPLTLSLKILGHGFLTDFCGWIPQCKVIPKCLQLPSCVPGEVVYSTFMIERCGHLPSTFTICLPKESSFTIQPPLGCISGDFQLFVIRFNGKLKEGIYVEDLNIIYNDSPEYCDAIRLKTSVEIPEIVIGQGNFFNFDCTFPLSKTEAMIPLENRTNLTLSFELVIPEDISWLDIPYPSGVIEPMTSCLVNVIFQPEEPCEHEGRIVCKVSSTSKVDYCETISVEFTGSCQYGYIIATPNNHDFGECNYYEKKSIAIYLYNFSPVVLHYTLSVVLDDQFDLADSTRNVKIKPDKGFILGKSSVEATVTIQPHEKGNFKYYILCQIMESDSKNATPCDTPSTIFTVRYTGVLPSFQIVDLSVDGGGPLFSPHWLWKMLSIDSLNKILDSLESEEPPNLYFPAAVVGSPKLIITLLLEAKPFGEISWKMKKTALCNSSSSEENRDKNEECALGKAMNITPKEGRIDANGRLNMDIIVNYDNPGEFAFQWTIILQQNRKISFNCMIETLSPDGILSASVLMPPPSNLRPVFIGNEDPPLQLIWLYNNTPRSSSYKVEQMTSVEVSEFPQKVFDCINPNGVIPPFSCLPLKILFKPTQVKSYTVEIMLSSNDNNIEVPIKMSGDGAADIILLEESSLFEKTVPEKPLLQNEKISLECSVNLISIPYMKSFSQVKRIFFIRNTSTTNIWAFQWHLFYVEDLIKAHVEPCEGEIQPGQEAIMTLVLNSFGCPSFIDFSLPCDIINYSLLAAHETHNQFFNSSNEKLQDYFTVTERGMVFDVPDIPKPEKPKQYHLFLTVNTSVLSPLNVDQKLLAGKDSLLNSSEELECYENRTKPQPKPTELLLFQNVLERIIWNILNTKTFKAKSVALSTKTDCTYLEILPGCRKKWKAPGKSYSLPQNLIQSFLEDVAQHIIYKKCRKAMLTHTEPEL